MAGRWIAMRHYDATTPSGGEEDSRGTHVMPEQSPPEFGGLLRQLRTRAQLTQRELAQAATLSTRTVSDLERGVNCTARKTTAELLAKALGLAGPERTLFITAARSRP